MRTAGVEGLHAEWVAAVMDAIQPPTAPFGEPVEDAKHLACCVKYGFGVCAEELTQAYKDRHDHVSKVLGKLAFYKPLVELPADCPVHLPLVVFEQACHRTLEIFALVRNSYFIETK